MITLYLLVALFLLFLNAFFVLAEFAMVKIRTSQVEEMIDQGEEQAKNLRHIQDHLDEYLSVCQLGITFASIGLGFVGEPSIAKLLEPTLSFIGHPSRAVSHALAIGIAYFLISFLHIVLGELVPKSIAIRSPEVSALRVVQALKYFRFIFAIPLFFLNSLSNFVLKILRIPTAVASERHSEEEIRIILSRSQTSGLMSFRQLLLLENIFDLGDLYTGEVMRNRSSVRTLAVNAPWEENYRVIFESKYSRYPLLDGSQHKPIGVIHVKDLIFNGSENMSRVDLRSIARPFVATSEETLVENLLAELQRKRMHVAMVFSRQNEWVGFVTMEDIAEQIVGAVEDEFERESPVSLVDALSLDRIILNVQAPSIPEGVKQVLNRVPRQELPLPADQLIKAVLGREKLSSTYLGRGLSIPHARLKEIDRPVLFFARSDAGIPVGSGYQRAQLLFILVTPTHLPQLQVRLLGRIARLFESEFVEERLKKARTSQEIYEAIQAGEIAALSN